MIYGVNGSIDETNLLDLIPAVYNGTNTIIMINKLNRKKILIFFIVITIYLFTISSLIKYKLMYTYSFGFNELLLKSILHFLLLILLFKFLYIFLNKSGIKIKFLISFIISILFFNFWYTYNSFPTVQNIKVINKSKGDIHLFIKQIYLFDKSYGNNLKLNTEFEFILFGGGEYNLLEDKIMEIEGYYEGKKIYSKSFNTYIITKGIEIEPLIIIK